MPRATDRQRPHFEATNDHVGRLVFFAAVACIAATLLAWHNSVTGPFIFDDIPSIEANKTIRHWTTALLPPGDSGATVSGRPILNLSLAVNYAIGGLDATGYHVGNIALHIGAGLVLLGLVRRVLPLASERLRSQPRTVAAMAGATALLWAVHPLQTESVTYVIQRAESLAGLFYLLTVYAFVRSTEPGTPHPGSWRAFSIAACLFGVASKEVVATAPLFVLILDRTWVAGTFREAWRKRRGYYLALAASWILLGMLVGWAGRRGDTAGFGLTITPWAYLLTQAKAIGLYLRLSFWPHPLVLDYGRGTVGGIITVLPQLVLIVGLLGATIAALVRRSWLGIAGAWFFLILGPSSSIIPVATQTMAEHRMYLPLAAVMAGSIILLHRLVRGRFVLFAPIVAVAAIALTATTIARNNDYRTAESIWRDTNRKQPDNPRPFEGLGVAFQKAGRLEEARDAFETALSMGSRNPAVHGALGNVLLDLGQVSAARTQFELSLRLDDKDPRAHSSLGNALLAQGLLDAAIGEQTLAVELDPIDPDFRYNLANTLAMAGRFDEAIEQFRAALRLAPEMIEARFNLANALGITGRLREAEVEFRAVVAMRPDIVDAWSNLGDTLVQLGRVAEARSAYEQALARAPDHAAAREGLRRLAAGR